MARKESLNRGSLDKDLKGRRERGVQILREEPSGKRDSECKGPDLDHDQTVQNSKAHVVGTGPRAVSERVSLSRTQDQRQEQGFHLRKL